MHTPIGQLPAIDIDAMLAHTKMLSSDEFEGRAPGTKGEDLTVNYLADRVQEGRPRSPATPTARTSRRCRSSASRRRRRRSCSRRAADEQTLKWNDDVVAWTKHVARRRRASTTPSWCSSATASSRPSSTGTTTRASTSRARRSSCSSTIRRCPIPANPSELDPKMFGGKAMTYYGRWTYKFEIGAREGRGRRAHRSTRPVRPAIRSTSCRTDHRRAVRSRDARQEHGAGGDRGLDLARPGPGRC